MKKKCKYCGGIVKINENEIKNIEDKGRGVLCDLCGSFIEVPKKTSSTSSSVSRYRTYGRGSYHRKKQVIILIFVLFIIASGFILFNLGQWVYTEKKYSTFQFSDEYTERNISDDLNISILCPGKYIVFVSDTDIYRLSNFEMTIYNKKISTIQIDIKPYDYIWLYTDPINASVYRSNYYLIKGGKNDDFVFLIKMEGIYYL